MVDFALRDQVEAIKARHDQEAALVLAEHPRAAQAEVDALIPEKGTQATMRQAATKWGVSPNTVANWVKYGWVAVIRQGSGQGSATLIDEHDVARIALTHNVSQGRRMDRAVDK